MVVKPLYNMGYICRCEATPPIDFYWMADRNSEQRK